jgi:hypothetical protein
MKLYIYPIAVLLLTGCTTNKIEKYDHDMVVTNKILTQSALGIKKSYENLYVLEASKQDINRENDLKKFEHKLLLKRASIALHGPVDSVIKQICAISGLEYRTLGVKPSIPIIVDIDAQNQPLSHILRDLNYQIAKYATIILDKVEQVIELKYEN